MSDTISAKLVAEGVGLPPMFVSPGGHYCGCCCLPSDREHLDLIDPQTAFGLALRLDEWGDDIPEDFRALAMASWADCAANILPHIFLPTMAARIEHIGMDHAIRRALGWEVEPGTLATLTPVDGVSGMWRLNAPREAVRYWWREFDLPSVTDPAEALRAIYAEVWRK